MVVSAIIWCICRQKNDLCFNDSITHSGWRVIIGIISLVVFWRCKMSEEIQQATQAWLPKDLGDVPLQVASPEDEHMIGWLSEDSA